jgi:hypothetical protein
VIGGELRCSLPTPIARRALYPAGEHRGRYCVRGLGFVPRDEAGGFIGERNTAPGSSCRSTPMAAISPTCIPACARCVVPLPPKSPAPGSRSATASVACPPPPARSSCGTNRLRPSKISPCRHEAIDKGAGWKSVPSRENRNSGVSAPTSRRRAARTTRHGCETYWDPAFTLGNIAHRGSK